jgi:hypothetical protein
MVPDEDAVPARLLGHAAKLDQQPGVAVGADVRQSDGKSHLAIPSQRGAAPRRPGSCLTPARRACRRPAAHVTRGLSTGGSPNHRVSRLLLCSSHEHFVAAGRRPAQRGRRGPGGVSRSRPTRASREWSASQSVQRARFGDQHSVKLVARPRPPAPSQAGIGTKPLAPIARPSACRCVTLSRCGRLHHGACLSTLGTCGASQQFWSRSSRSR